VHTDTLSAQSQRVAEHDIQGYATSLHPQSFADSWGVMAKQGGASNKQASPRASLTSPMHS
jgi:hypothetical protein